MGLLLDLPFVDAGRDGIVDPRSRARARLRTSCTVRTPSSIGEYRRSAWRQLRSEVREAAAGRPLALHRRHALPDRQSGRSRGLLPVRLSAARDRAGARGRRRGDGGDRERDTKGREAAGLLDAGGRIPPRPSRSAAIGMESSSGSPACSRRCTSGRRRVPGIPVVDSWTQHLREQAGAEGPTGARLPPLARPGTRRAPMRVAGRILARREARPTWRSSRPATDLRRRAGRADLLAGRARSSASGRSREQEGSSSTARSTRA